MHNIINVPRHAKLLFASAKTKAQISYAVVFAMKLVQFQYFLIPKLQASIHLVGNPEKDAGHLKQLLNLLCIV